MTHSRPLEFVIKEKNRGIRALWVAAFFVLASTLSACKSESNYFVSENASEGDGSDNGAPTSATGLRVRVKAKSGVDSFIHKFGDVNASCEIPKADANTPTAINCMLNMMEYDVWFHGFEYELNIPEGFCSYLEETPYRYYMAPPGYMPASAAVTVTNGVMTACTVGGVAPPLGFNGAGCNTGEGIILPTGSFRCAYDYSLDGATGPNCCAGRMSLSLTIVDTTVTPNTSNTSNTDVSGGGAILNCIDTPHKYAENWPLMTNGLPAIAVSELGYASYTRTQKIPSEFSVRTQRPMTVSNSFLAGFHGWAQYAANAATWNSTRTVPRAFAPLRDRGPNGDFSSGSSIPSLGEGSYEFSCLGPAGELRHGIRVYLNEWNTVEDYQAYKANGDASAVDPTRTGTAGVDCAAVNTGDSCNSFWGFDDLVNAFGGGNPGAWVFPAEYWGSSP